MIQASSPYNVLYIDENPVCRLGLAKLLETTLRFRLTHALSSIQQLTAKPDVDLVIVEISSSRPKGIATVRELKARFPNSPLLVLSAYEECIYADRCLKAGATGFIMKTASFQEIIAAIETVNAGDLYVSENVKSFMINRLANPDFPEISNCFHNLSDRELLIVEQIGLSKNNKEIAQALQISVKTIESHRSRIKAKLRLGSPQDLMRYAMRMHSF